LVDLAKTKEEKDFEHELQELDILRECESDYIVKYYGSYFKDTTLLVSHILHNNKKKNLFDLAKRTLTDCHGVLQRWIYKRYDQLMPQIFHRRSNRRGLLQRIEGLDVFAWTKCIA